MMKRYDMIVVGAGPAGLSAAIEAAKKGMHVVVYDENAKPGGQLFKQIHKFFGSKEHKAKIRGFHIGEELLAEAASLGVEVVLNAIVIGIFRKGSDCQGRRPCHPRQGGHDSDCHRRKREHGHVSGLDAAGRHRRRCSADHDEPPRHTAGQACADAGLR